MEHWLNTSTVLGRSVSGFISPQKPTCNLSLWLSNCCNRFDSVMLGAVNVRHCSRHSEQRHGLDILLHSRPCHRDCLKWILPANLISRRPLREAERAFPKSNFPLYFSVYRFHVRLSTLACIAHINHGAKSTTTGSGRSAITRDKTGFV